MFNFKSYYSMTAIILLALAYLLSCSSGSQMVEKSPEDLSKEKNTLYSQATEKMKQANQVNAELLSPNTYKEANSLYQQAESGMDSDEDWTEIRSDLLKSIDKFEEAKKNAELAQVTLSAAIDARNDAKETDADEHAKSIWEEANEEFKEAVNELEEDGDVNEAKEHGDEAKQNFRKAELEAIKTNYLSETWNLLDQAEEMDVEDRAPKTLQLAKNLADSVEKILEQDRYDRDVARSVAKQAKAEAKHAIYLSKYIEELKEKDATYEEIILASEKPIKRIATNLDVVAKFDEGYDKPADKIIDAIEDCQYNTQKLQQQLTSAEAQNDAFAARIDELEENLSSKEELNTTLAKEVQRQEELQEKFNKVDKMFSRDQADVLRKENNVIIRLHGLNFEVGKAAIDQKYYDLLAKVQKAIRLFPESNIVIEGHTDSFGSDELNMELSEDRAQAVKQYLVSNMQLDSSEINAKGLGESNPVANNETASGREKNRRIDVVILSGWGEQEVKVGTSNK